MVTNHMGDNYVQLGAVQAEIEAEKARLSELRRRERRVSARERSLYRGMGAQEAAVQAPGSVQSFESQLHKVLPPGLIPGNIGHKDAVQWPFWHVFRFDFGTNPTLTAATRLTASFQVTQESALLMMALSWEPESYTTSGYLGPWQIEFRDRQSSRQFNDAPIPLQTYGGRSNPSILPVSMFLLPNAFLDATMTVDLPAGAASQATTGSGVHEIVVFGYRTRETNPNKLLRSLFK